MSRRRRIVLMSWLPQLPSSSHQSRCDVLRDRVAAAATPEVLGRAPRSIPPQLASPCPHRKQGAPPASP
eukprot:3679232-Rhodomonas_salina.1